MPYSKDYIKEKLEKELEPLHVHFDSCCCSSGRTKSERMTNYKKTIIVGLALLVRICVSYYPYSGANKPLMYGDYEAQRHWQEITLNLPISQWYSNSSDNDLQYWGLDYPPLTAYHSLLVAHSATTFNLSESVQLHKSRGYESNEHKFFMRCSVLVVDLLIFLPAVLYFCRKQQQPTDLASLTSLLCYPGIILIDYGHFQYNCVSLGLFVAAVALLTQDSIKSAACFFVLALNYKQMELYHALPFFFYILGFYSSSSSRRSVSSSLYSIIGVALTVLGTFGVIWAPFLLLPQQVSSLQDAILRLFPLKRGIFEDKVANVWCAINVLYKLKSNFTHSQLALICLITTALALVPSSLDLLLRPSKSKFLLALINSSLAFFLFSFQVHEKSILLAAIPALLSLHQEPLGCFWFSIISVFSMLPLLIKDGLLVAYFASLILFVVISFPQSSFAAPRRLLPISNAVINTLFSLSLLGVVILSGCSILLPAPKRYPDLYSLLVSVYSCAHFIVFLVYFNYKQIFTTGIAAATTTTSAAALNLNNNRKKHQ